MKRRPHPPSSRLSGNVRLLSRTRPKRYPPVYRPPRPALVSVRNGAGADRPPRDVRAEARPSADQATAPVRDDRETALRRRPGTHWLVAAALASALALPTAWIGLDRALDDVPSTLAGCAPTVPVPMLATRSKYRSDDPVAATLGTHAASRARTLEPIRADVLAIARGAHGNADQRRCAAHELVRWARSGALTDMRTKDAMLSRARLASELALAGLALQASGDLHGADARVVANWSEGIARSTVRWFEWEAGPKSRRNNHRLWAALAVGAAGRLAERPELTSWARESRAVAVCDLDANGHLPLELARGERALRYHVYALRPLLALERLDQGPAFRPCAKAVERLTGAVAAMLSDPSAMSLLTGRTQLPPAAASAFGPDLRLPPDLSRTVRASR